MPIAKQGGVHSTAPIKPCDAGVPMGAAPVAERAKPSAGKASGSNDKKKPK